MPQYLSPEAQSLLRSLFKRNPANRLGSGPEGGKEMKSHQFFSTIDFEKLFKKEITPPFIPAINRTDSLFYFDKEFTNKAPEGQPFMGFDFLMIRTFCLSDSPGVPPSANAHELFRGFSFVAPNLYLDENIQNNENNTNITNSPETANTSHNVSKMLLRTITKCKERSLNDYEFFEELGKGSFSCCRRCVHKESGKQYAVKV